MSWWNSTKTNSPFNTYQGYSITNIKKWNWLNTLNIFHVYISINKGTPYNAVQDHVNNIFLFKTELFQIKKLKWLKYWSNLIMLFTV